MRKPLDVFGQTAAETATDAVTRRSALRLGLAGLGAAALGATAWPRGAGAFTLQEADVPTTAAFHNACGNNAYHDQLASEVRSILVVRKTPANAMPQEVVCPICGCKVPV